MVNAALRVSLGSGPQGYGVRDVRNLCVAVGLTAVFVVSSISSGFAASANYTAGASYARSSNTSYSSNAAQMSRAEEPVPSNCIRQSCGKLWCWQMNGSKGSH